MTASELYAGGTAVMRSGLGGGGRQEAQLAAALLLVRSSGRIRCSEPLPARRVAGGAVGPSSGQARVDLAGPSVVGGVGRPGARVLRSPGEALFVRIGEQRVFLRASGAAGALGHVDLFDGTRLMLGHLGGDYYTPAAAHMRAARPGPAGCLLSPVGKRWLLRWGDLRLIDSELLAWIARTTPAKVVVDNCNTAAPSLQRAPFAQG